MTFYKKYQFDIILRKINIDKAKDILKDDGQIIGVCFMNMFTKVNWLDKFDFDWVFVKN